MGLLAGSPSLVGRKAWRWRHSSAVKRHSLLWVAQNLSRINWNIVSGGGGYQQVAILTGLKDSFAGAQERVGSAGTTALTAYSTYYHRVNVIQKIFLRKRVVPSHSPCC